jgi:large subunit ribosomal protein L10
VKTKIIMALTKQKKEEVYQRVQGALNEANSVVFVHSKGMTVGDTEKMRKQFRDNGISYYVAKKTLIKKALEEKKFDGEQPIFESELALAWGEDFVAPAREVQSFVKSTKEKVTILGGIFEGRYMSAEEMTEIATIPSQHTLYAQFVNVIHSPIQGFVVSLSKIAEKKEATA